VIAGDGALRELAEPGADKDAAPTLRRVRDNELAEPSASSKDTAPFSGDPPALLSARRAIPKVISQRAARRVILSLLRRLRGGVLTLVEPDGRRIVLGDRYRAPARAPLMATPPNPDRGEPRQSGSVSRPAIETTVTVHSFEAYRAVLLGGGIGLGQAYIDGLFSVEDLDDLVALLRLLTANLALVEKISDLGERLLAPFTDLCEAATSYHLGHRPARHPARSDANREGVRAHYDLGNDFFSLFLDETLTYSCGIFADPSTTMHDASLAKLDRICTKLGLTENDDVLEIGSGWGSFAIHAARHYGCSVTTTTISAEQYRYASDAVRSAGLEDRITVLDAHYLDLTGSYDKIVSIEMIEAIGWRQHQQFFEQCASLLRPGGQIAIQSIVIADQEYERAKRRDDFIKRFVFPGGCLPSVGSLVTTAARATDFGIISVEEIGHHYTETLRRWREAFSANLGELPRLGLDAGFQRLWEMYLCYCEAGFTERLIGDVQIVWARRGWRPPGLGGSSPTA
jgi:cyclopropane-fatty-acyl-phospholipid synthase